MDLAEVGYFSKTHGVKGQLILKCKVDFYYEELKALFIETATGKAPYFVSEIKPNKDGFIVGLEDIISLEKASALTRKSVFINQDLIIENEETDWNDFELIDANHGSLGKVLETVDNGTQVLITLNYKNTEILLPLVEELIERVDEDAKKIYYNSPIGLVEMYLENNKEN
jgi:16S rRNA processing protein RimM